MQQKRLTNQRVKESQAKWAQLAQDITKENSEIDVETCTCHSLVI